MRCKEVLSIFPAKMQALIRGLGLSEENLQEIRLRAGRPLLALCAGREYRSGQAVSLDELQETLAYLSGYSLYAYEDEIRQGFLSLPGGHRVGLAGRAVMDSQRVKTLTEISSFNVRFAHEMKGCADPVLPYLWEDGRLMHTLIVSAPGKGKTTLLRDCIRQISDGSAEHEGLTVGVVDERSELAGSFRGVPGNDMGLRTDVLDGCPKAEGMMMLIRSMSPRVMAVDEIGGRGDLEALRYAMHCGCVLLATVHGSSAEELKRKPVLRKMMKEKLFERFVILSAAGRPGRVARILDGSGQTLWEEGGRC